MGRICGSGEGHAGVSSAANAPRLMTSPTRVLTLRRHVETSHLEDDKAGREGTSWKHFLLLIGSILSEPGTNQTNRGFKPRSATADSANDAGKVSHCSRLTSWFPLPTVSPPNSWYPLSTVRVTGLLWASAIGAATPWARYVARIQWSPDSQFLLTEVARQGLLQVWSMRRWLRVGPVRAKKPVPSPLQAWLCDVQFNLGLRNAHALFTTRPCVPR